MAVDRRERKGRKTTDERLLVELGSFAEHVLASALGPLSLGYVGSSRDA